MSKRNLLIALFIIFVLYGLINIFLLSPESSREQQDAILTVSIVTPQNSVIDERINVTGATIPRESIMVISELSGARILEVLADVGDKVKPDQILARLDSESYQHQMQQLESEFNRLHDEFKRVDALRDTGVVSQELLVQKRTSMEAAKAKLADAQLNVDRTIIRSPVEGIIFERNVQIGGLVNVNEPLYRIAREGEIEIEAQVPEAQLIKLKLDQGCELQLSGNSKPLMGRIRLITPQINSASRTASIRITLDEYEPLPVGLFTHIEINLGEISGSLLPATVIQQDSAGFYVFALDKDNKAYRLPIDIKLRSEEGIVVDYLPNDVRIVARAGAFLKEGEKVNVAESL